MSNKVLIASILLFAFSLIQAHNFVPHIHFDDVFELSHHHDHEYEHESQTPVQNDKEDEPYIFFSHLQHIVTSEELIFELCDNFRFHSELAPKQLFKKNYLVLLPLSISLKSGPNAFILIKPNIQAFYDSHSFRAPPLDTV